MVASALQSGSLEITLHARNKMLLKLHSVMRTMAEDKHNPRTKPWEYLRFEPNSAKDLMLDVWQSPTQL